VGGKRRREARTEQAAKDSFLLAMAIQTNPSFDTNNAALVKRPLYVLSIAGMAAQLTTFLPQELQVAVSGYGVNGYGTTGYGY
jgi:hypothetical protein